MSKSERTKRLIIEKAAPIFNKKGFAATAINDILEATGLAKGGVYGNFESKEEVALSVFEYANTQLLAAIWNRVKVEKTATDKLAAIFDFYHNYTLQPILEGGCPILNAAVDADYIFPELKSRVAAASKEMLDSLVHVIDKGIAMNEFKADLNAKAEANLIFSVIEGGMMMSKLHDDPAYLNNLLLYLHQHIKTFIK